MEIQKSIIRYRGKYHPCITVSFTEKEADEVRLDQKIILADNSLLCLLQNAKRNGIWEATDKSDGECDVDSKVNFYMFGSYCQLFNNDEIAEEQMMDIIREILC